jgi:hypothetical protein
VERIKKGIPGEEMARGEEKKEIYYEKNTIDLPGCIVGRNGSLMGCRE